MKSQPILFALLWMLFAASCNKDNAPIEIPGVSGVYICNEGNFNFGSAEVSFYDPDKQEVSNGLFYAANNYSLGDVAQSFFVRDSIGFIVVNNSQKIEVVKVPSMVKIRTIAIPNSSPRYVHPINDSVMYVSELYKSKIYVVNYQAGVIEKEISGVSRWTEHFLQHGDDVLVEERNLDAFPNDSAGFAVINTLSHTVTQHYSFSGSNINGMVADKNGLVWVLMNRDTTHSAPASLVCLNSDLSLNWSIAAGNQPQLLSISGGGDELYFVDGDVFRLSITDNQIPSTPFIEKSNRNIYAMAIEPATGDIYLSDALDFIQPSRIFRYSKDGQLIHSFTAGLISGNFAFRNQ